MAFEAMLTQGAARPSARRRLTYSLSIAFHAALVTVGVVYSFWHVEELSPPTVKVTFLSALPPPPPPPPPAGGNGAPKKKATPKPKVTAALVQPKPTLVQPKETPRLVAEEKKPPKEDPKKKTDDDDDDALPGGVVGGTKGGQQGGVIGGTVGGTPGGAVDAPMVPKMLAPNMGMQHKLSGDDPPFPAILKKAGARYLVVAKICVSKTGSVDSVTLMKKADPLLDPGVERTIKTWRYTPVLVGSTPVPFCYPASFEFKAD